MDRATYLRELVAAYQGEVRGEAMFATLADLSANADERDTWKTLARLEAATRQRLMPLMQRHGLDTTPDDAQARLGRARGEARAGGGFAAAIKAMHQALPPFLALYQRLEAEGPPADRDGLAFLNAHEVALNEFATRTLAGDKEPLLPVRALLDE